MQEVVTIKYAWPADWNPIGTRTGEYEMFRYGPNQCMPEPVYRVDTSLADYPKTIQSLEKMARNRAHRSLRVKINEAKFNQYIETPVHYCF